jgi:hypothetical protein
MGHLCHIELWLEERTHKRAGRWRSPRREFWACPALRAMYAAYGVDTTAGPRLTKSQDNGEQAQLVDRTYGKAPSLLHSLPSTQCTATRVRKQQNAALAWTTQGGADNQTTHSRTRRTTRDITTTFCTYTSGGAEERASRETGKTRTF